MLPTRWKVLPVRCNFSTPATVNVAKSFTEWGEENSPLLLENHILFPANLTFSVFGWFFVLYDASEVTWLILQANLTLRSNAHFNLFFHYSCETPQLRDSPLRLLQTSNESCCSLLCCDLQVEAGATACGCGIKHQPQVNQTFYWFQWGALCESVNGGERLPQSQFLCHVPP